VSICPLLKILDGKVSCNVLFLLIDFFEFAWPTLSVYLSLLIFTLSTLLYYEAGYKAARSLIGLLAAVNQPSSTVILSVNYTSWFCTTCTFLVNL